MVLTLPVASRLVLEMGDVILEVDNKELESVVDINRYLFLRNSKKVKVKHASGKIEVINIPENFGSRLFEAGEIIPLSPRISNTLDSIVKGGPQILQELNQGIKLLLFLKIRFHLGTILQLISILKKTHLSLLFKETETSIIKYVYPKENSFLEGILSKILN